MAAIAVPAMTAPPTLPVRGDRANFGVQAQAWTLWEKNYKYPESIALANNVYANAVEAKAQADRASAMADNAASAATTSQTAAAVALGAANFKGLWATLAGALNRPACVKHSGRFWLLVRDLANVASSTPSDANADWVSLDAGASPSAVITSDTPAVVGVRYRIAAACTLTIPTSGLLRGDFIGWALMDGVVGARVDFGPTKCHGRDVGMMTLTVPREARSLYYEDATRGMCQ